MIIIVLAIVGTFGYLGFKYFKQTHQTSTPLTFYSPIASPTVTPTLVRTNPAASPTNSTITINPVTKWKIYTNKVYGFSIEYPETVIVDEKAQEGTLIVFFRLKQIDNDQLMCSGTQLVINVNTEGACGSLAYKGTTSKILESKYLLGKVLTTRYDDYIQDKHVETRLDTISQGNNSYYLNYFIAPEDYPQLDETHKLFNQLLSTFKFT